ncbi:conserved Plasmodium protein, unknown function [Plasmodium sp. gorilla clade G2]|uniref:conserved Plasmodium protein, unknown function n=1 Tax=Plasmodium sp. gorilla clade G2 TaxID=880535 RepID=UPI000D209EDD|nr:conserved Plasmodium protein, unknown function [Plasmodium sp. gorilla clade G2]SOV14707.1 conserved Plasmodium protein, unknown function [Plasmodium sp. gorilla clade G2]
MYDHKTFKDLLQFYDNLEKEEVLVLFFHSTLLDNNYIYELKSEKKIVFSENENLEINDSYVKYKIDKRNNDFLITRILIHPEWRNNNHNYNFTYKQIQTSDTYNLNILKIGNSLVIQLIDIEDPSSIHSCTINIHEYINKNMPDKYIHINNFNQYIYIDKLQKIFQTNILNYMNRKNKNKETNHININNINTCQTQDITIKTHTNNFDKNYLLHNFNDTYFDDKNPPILTNTNLPSINQPHPILKPDGLLVGPNNKFFNPAKLRYDPMGPFGNEPNSDNRPFEFQNNFPF